MGNRSSHSSSRAGGISASQAAGPLGDGPQSSYVPITSGPIPGDTGVRVVCPRCRTVLMPPAQLFRCPCGQLMTYNSPDAADTPLTLTSANGADRSTVVVMSGSGSAREAPRFVVQRSGPMARMDAEDRLRFLLQRLPPDDPYAMFLRLLLARLPHRSDGTLNLDALEDVARQLDAEVRGAPQGLIDLLPTRTFAKSLLPPELANKDEHTTCTVCMCEYEEGELLRTLPCLHCFHQGEVSLVVPGYSRCKITMEHRAGCIDPWLRTNKSCPVCKTPIDIDQEELLHRQLEAEVILAAGPQPAAAHPARK